VLGRYCCLVDVALTVRIEKWPPLSLSRMRAKTDGESKCGRHSWATVPEMDTRAQVRRLPMMPWSCASV